MYDDPMIVPDDETGTLYYLDGRGNIADVTSEGTAGGEGRSAQDTQDSGIVAGLALVAIAGAVTGIAIPYVWGWIKMFFSWW